MGFLSKLLQAAKKFLSDESSGFSGTPFGGAQPGPEFPGQHGPITQDVPQTPEEQFLNGKWFQVSSSNVGRITYDRAEFKLWVEYLPSGYHTYQPYWYYPVYEEQALAMFNSGSPGGWVWDNLRIRGTQYGHQVSYGPWQSRHHRERQGIP